MVKHSLGALKRFPTRANNRFWRRSVDHWLERYRVHADVDIYIVIVVCNIRRRLLCSA
jgi:hypothetical protein